jgi:predicted ATPase
VATAIDRGEDPPATGERRSGMVPTDLLLARFATLPQPAVRCAQAASVFGPRFQPDLAAEVARLPEADADAGLEALWSAGP